MNQTALQICKEVTGVRFAFVQSDEINILITDFDQEDTDMWFDGNIQKIASVTAAMATAHFNRLRLARALQSNDGESVSKVVYFDCRVFVIPDPTEVYNYFVWRQQDSTKNSLAMTAQAHFTHKELMGKKAAELQDMLMLDKKVNWNDMPAGFKRGRFIVKEVVTTELKISKGIKAGETTLRQRSVWTVMEPPIITKEPQWLRQRIPQYDRN